MVMYIYVRTCTLFLWALEGALLNHLIHEAFRMRSTTIFGLAA